MSHSQQAEVSQEAVAGMMEMTQCTAQQAQFMLEASMGDMQRAIAMYYEESQIAASPPGRSSPMRVAATPPRPLAPLPGSAGPRRQHSDAGPPARAPQQQGILAFVVNLPLDVVRLGLRLVAGVFNLGASLVSLLGQRLLPGPVYHMFAGAVQAVRQGGQELDAQLAAASFNNRFRDTYGTVQPRWLECGWQEATQQAHAEFKFLFVYLHSPQHQDTRQFCQGTLCDPEVVGYLNEECLAWGGDVSSSNAWRLSSSLQVTTYPYVGLLAFSGARTRLVASVQGTTGPQQLLQTLRKAIDDHGAEFVAERTERNERDFNRRLREEQDAEYEAGLAADQERERQRAAKEQAAREVQEAEEAAAAKQQAEEDAARHREEQAAMDLQQRRASKKATLPSEPAAGPQVASIRVRLPDGSSAQRRFRAANQLQDVHDFVDSLDALTSLNYSLASTHPRKVYDSSCLQQTLTELGLTPSAMLLVQYADK